MAVYGGMRARAPLAELASYTPPLAAFILDKCATVRYSPPMTTRPATERSPMRRCTTCNRPANDRYSNAAAGEVCVDRAHDPYLTAAQLCFAEIQREAIASRSAS
jgi:hypothetical protein